MDDEKAGLPSDSENSGLTPTDANEREAPPPPPPIEKATEKDPSTQPS